MTLYKGNTNDFFKKLLELISISLKWQETGQAPVAHTCNPNYSGDRDPEDCSSKPAWVNSS
jgi:hypothetical protein